MPQEWPLQDAKNQFSEVFERALTKGPQAVTRRGKDRVYIVSEADYNKLKKPKESLAALMRRSPLRGVKLSVTRNKDLPREVDL